MAKSRKNLTASSGPAGAHSHGREACQEPRRGGPQAAREASLGNLRNTYAGDQPAPHVSHLKEGEKPASDHAPKTTPGSDRRTGRLELQRTAARLTPNLRVAGCLWREVGQLVDLLRRGKDARFQGLQTCGSVWNCPCCSARISEVRRQELRQLEEWAGSPARGLRLVMMTLTARHRKRRLRTLVDRMAKAKARMQNRNPWKPLRRSGILFGSVSVREATHSAKNGWHPHYHVLCLVRAETDEDALAILEPLRRVWLNCLRTDGLTGTADRAFHLQTGDAVSAYLSKHGRDADDRAAALAGRPAWGIAEEMTLARNKTGQREGSRSPFQILRDAHEAFADGAPDEVSEKLWQEYALVMHGRRQQVWSDGLKALVGLDEVEDEQAAEGEEYTEDEDEILMQWHRDDWRRVRGLRAGILEMGELAGAAGVRALFLSADAGGRKMARAFLKLVREDGPEVIPALIAAGETGGLDAVRAMLAPPEDEADALDEVLDLIESDEPEAVEASAVADPESAQADQGADPDDWEAIFDLIAPPVSAAYAERVRVGMLVAAIAAQERDIAVPEP